jgi:hypothetical protein
MLSREFKHDSSSDEVQYLRRMKATAPLRSVKLAASCYIVLSPYPRGIRFIKCIMCRREYLLVHVDIHACLLLLLLDKKLQDLIFCDYKIQKQGANFGVNSMKDF